MGKGVKTHDEKFVRWLKRLNNPMLSAHTVAYMEMAFIAGRRSGRARGRRLMKHRKKPVVIEAMLYTRESCRDIHRWMEVEHEGHCSTGVIVIPTLEGLMEAREGDYIIKDVKGEFYPCKPDIFAATYEAVEGGA